MNSRSRVASAAVFLLVVSSGVVACAPGGPGTHVEIAPAPCQAAGANMEGWQRVEHAAFSFHIPPGYERVPVQPIDSEMARWTAGARRAVSYSLGWHSSDLHEAEPLAGYISCRMDLGGHPALLVAAWDVAGDWGGEGGPKLIVAATWRDILPGGELPVHLTLYATGELEGDYGTLVAIVRSVRIKTS